MLKMVGKIKYQSKLIKTSILLAFLSSLLLNASNSIAGAYVFAGTQQGVDIVTHPKGYTGTESIITIGVCIDPASQNSLEMEVPVRRIVNTYNDLQSSSGNLLLGRNNNIPSNNIDFESVALHEVGHCLGLAHTNAASESKLTGNQIRFAKAEVGSNGVYNLNSGADNVIGSADDIRGDDINRLWFQKMVNNPFTIANRVDSTTYSVNLTGNLPTGHSFGANPSREVATLLGFSNTEAVMHQGTSSDEAQRTLTTDDVATLRYAMSGLDEIQGNNDDYTIKLEYQGISNNANTCQITLSIKAISGLAFCSTNGSTISSGHIQITSASISFGEQFSWFFNGEDTVPEPFNFDNQNDVPINTSIISNNILISGINTATTISIINGEYAIGTGSFTSNPNSINAGFSVRVRHTSSSEVSTNTSTELTIGGIKSTFTSKTVTAIVGNEPIIDSEPNNNGNSGTSTDAPVVNKKESKDIQTAALNPFLLLLLFAGFMARLPPNYLRITNWI